METVAERLLGARELRSQDDNTRMIGKIRSGEVMSDSCDQAFGRISCERHGIINQSYSICARLIMSSVDDSECIIVSGDVRQVN